MGIWYETSCVITRPWANSYELVSGTVSDIAAIAPTSRMDEAGGVTSSEATGGPLRIP